MITFRNVLLKFLVTVTALLLSYLCSVGVVWGLTTRQRTHAEAFLQDFTGLEIGKSTFAEALALGQKYHGLPWYNGEGDMRCTFQSCALRFIFENKPLTAVRMARYVGLTLTISTQDGVVVGRDLTYVADSRPHWFDSFIYEVIERSSLDQKGWPERWKNTGVSRFNVKLRGTEGIATTVEIRLDSNSSAQERKRAYALNLSCLARVFGCGDPSAIFPAGVPYRGAPYQTHSDSW